MINLHRIVVSILLESLTLLLALMKQTALLEGPHDEELRIASNGQQETKALISKASRNRILPKTGKLRICFPLIEP